MDRAEARKRLRALVGALVLARDGADLALRGEPVEMSEVDRRALAGELEAGAHHLLRALERHPHWRGMSDPKRRWALDAFGTGGRLKLPDPECVHCLVLTAEGIALVLHRDEADAEAERELCRASVHLQRAVLLVDPGALRRRIAASDPDWRVSMGEWLRVLEEDVAETRRLAGAGPADRGPG